MSFQQLFSDPPVAYRIAPFWFWNGAMDEKEIIHQIREMAQQGIGGFFISARQGLEIPYLSDQWFQRVAVAIEAAQQYGLTAWLYDEYPYPSGMSGGEVTLLHPEAKHRTLLHQFMTITGPQTYTSELPWSKILSAQAIPLAQTSDTPLWSQALDIAPSIGIAPAASIFQSTGLTSYTNKRFFSAQLQKQLTWTVPPGRWLINIFLEKEIEDFKYYGTYVDPCHHEAIQTFIATTHEQYARRFRQYFGTTVKGVFTDEVGLMGRLPWSPRLPAFFREHYGSDLLENLPALLYPRDENAAQLRYQYFQSVHLLLGQAYHEPVSNWCDQHNLQYLTEVPCARITTQRYSHIPGGDSAHEKVGRSLEWILDRNAYSLRANPKIASSLARQLGHEWAMIECFHSVSWSMTLQDAKWMLDRLAAFGINFFVFHAFFYSISGLRKHDAPPSQFLQNPYWSHFRHLADYAARLSYALSQGRAHMPIAVIHPTTTFWTHLGNPFNNFKYAGSDPAEEQVLERLKQDWADLCKHLLLHHIDYDHLDPELLPQAIIEDGQLILGQARYEVLILPPMTNLEAAAWLQVKAFLQAGGKVIALGLLPYENIDSEQDIEPEMLQSFGLATSPRQHYWQEQEQRSQPATHAHAQSQGSRWAKGSHSAYFIPSIGNLLQSHALDQLLALLNQSTPPTLLIEPIVGDTKSFLTHQRILSDGSWLIFIAHQEGAAKTLRLHLTQHHSGQIVERLDLTSGKATAIPVEESANGRSISLSFSPYESHLLRLSYPQTAQETPEASVEVHAPSSPSWTFSPDVQQPWTLTAQQNNSLRFGTFHFALDLDHTGFQRRWHEGTVGQSWPLVEARTLISQCADLAATQPFPLQFKQPFGVTPRLSLLYPLHCWYQTSFLVEELPSACKLVMDEDAIGGDHTFYLNGEKIAAQNFVLASRYGHPQRTYDVQRFLKPGTNHLVISVEAHQDWHGICDPLYLDGPFGIFFNDSALPIIGKSPSTGVPQSAVHPGYPYYAGTLNFTRDIHLETLPREKTFILALQNWDEHIYDCVEVLINGHSLGTCCWSPYHWSGQSSLLHAGTNSIEIRITNTLSGLLEGTYFDYRFHRVVPVNEASHSLHFPYLPHFS